MTKIVIVSVPFVDDPTPLAAPAVLKASLNRHGFDCDGIDLNIDVYNKIKHDTRRNLFLKFFYEQKISEEIVDDISNMLNFYVDEILKRRPTVVGLSLFCHTCQTFTAWLCALLRHHAPDLKIVIGGPGLQTLENSLYKYPDRLKNMKLIDDYITGDADESFVEYLKGNKIYPGINSTAWVPVKNFDGLPPPDYSDYQFFRYSYTLLPIIDSRGCVQNCEFCDVIAFWDKFQSLTAEKIMQRMQYFIELYGVYRFQFSSSICNGNLKEFRKFVKIVADFNKKAATVESQIHWIGSFIVRKKTYHTDELFQLIKESNGTLLTGVESVVERVRIDLGKKFTNDDLEHHMVMVRKYKIPINILMIATYPGETEDEFSMAKRWFIDHKEFAGNPVLKVQLTKPAVLPGTKLSEKVKNKEVAMDRSIINDRAEEIARLIESCGFVTDKYF